MICRIWHGFTAPANAGSYETLLREDILPGIGRVDGYKGAQLFKRLHEDEVEFVTITYFENIKAVIDFAGEDYTKAVIPPHAKHLLSRYDVRSAHYDLVDMSMPEVFKKFN